MGSAAYWFATGLALLFSVFFSVAEGALLSYSPSRLEETIKDPRRRKRVESYLADVDRYHFSTIVLSTLSDVVLIFAILLGFSESVPQERAALYAFLVSVPVITVLAGLVPRAVAEPLAEALLPRILPVIAFVDRALAPLTYPLRALNRTVGRAFGGDARARRAEEIVDDIRSAALEGSREGVLDPEAPDMIEAVIEFNDVEVRTIMTPRTDMVSIEVNTPIQEAVKIAVDQGHSRIPVYDGTRDRIHGVLYAKDLLRMWGKSTTGAAGGQKDISLRQLVRKPYFIPETKVIGDLLREFRARKVHIAIVLDEYGGTAGVVTIEDIIEEIVGEIEDEFDDGDQAPPTFKRLDELTAEADARMHIYELNEKLGTTLPENGGDYETLGGFLFYSMGKVPKKGERFVSEGVEFTIADADERQIKRVRMRTIREQPAT